MIIIYYQYFWHTRIDANIKFKYTENKIQQTMINKNNLQKKNQEWKNLREYHLIFSYIKEKEEKN